MGITKRSELTLRQTRDEIGKRNTVLENELIKKDQEVIDLKEKAEIQKKTTINLKQEIIKLNEEIQAQMEHHEKEILMMKRSHRNQHRTLSVQIDSTKEQLNMSTFDHKSLKHQLSVVSE